MHIYREDQDGGRHVISDMCVRLDFVQELPFPPLPHGRL